MTVRGRDGKSTTYCPNSPKGQAMQRADTQQLKGFQGLISIELPDTAPQYQRDVVELTRNTLNKMFPLSAPTSDNTMKRKAATMDANEETTRESSKKAKQSEVASANTSSHLDDPDDEATETSPHFAPTPTSTSASEDLSPYISKIALSSLTPFRKRVLTALCQVPRGHYTTYGALSAHLSSSPRAVGNALENNPYAPQVPCHRVLATGGGLGGFKGSWGRKGESGVNDGLKVELLRGEGVRFDGRGRVVGGVWEGFV